MNKSLLMIAPYFVPRRRVGAYRPFRFAAHLREFGWNPYVITIGSYGDTLTEKEKRLLEGVEILTLNPPVDTTKDSGSHLGKGTRGKNSAAVSFIGKWIDRHFPIDTWLPFLMTKWSVVKQFVVDSNPDAVWSTGDPWSAHWVGRKIKRNYPELPWIADFRDPWTLTDVNLKKRSSLSSMMDRRVEKSVVSEASVLTFTSENTRKKYEEHYGREKIRAHTIYNAFDLELYEAGRMSHPHLGIEENSLNIMFFGRFRRLSPATPLVDILSVVKARDPRASENIRIFHFGPLDEHDSAYARSKGVETCFYSCQPVPPEQTLEVLEDADILFLSTDTDRDDIIPAKLWDYLAAKRPVLSIAPNPEIRYILEETGVGVQIDHGNSESAADLLIACLQGKQNGTELPIRFNGDEEKIEKYEAKNATRRLAEILDKELSDD